MIWREQGGPQRKASLHRVIIDPRPRAIKSGGITRIGDAINIRLTDWAEHRSRPNQPRRTLRCIESRHRGHPVTALAVTTLGGTAVEPGASNRNGSHSASVSGNTVSDRPRQCHARIASDLGGFPLPHASSAAVGGGTRRASVASILPRSPSLT